MPWLEWLFGVVAFLYVLMPFFEPWLSPSSWFSQPQSSCFIMFLSLIVSCIQGRDVQFQEELPNISMLAKLQDLRMVIRTSYLNYKGIHCRKLVNYWLPGITEQSLIWKWYYLRQVGDILIFKNVKIVICPNKIGGQVINTQKTSGNDSGRDELWVLWQGTGDFGGATISSPRISWIQDL